MIETSLNVGSDDKENEKEIDEQKRSIYHSLSRVNDRFIIKTILESKLNEKITLTMLAKKLGVKPSNIQHTFEDLKDNNLVNKNNNRLTICGKEIYRNFEPFLDFMVKNKEYFEDHNFDDLPFHFRTSIGIFKSCSHITGKDGFIEIQRKELEIVKNSKKYVYNLLNAGRYDLELINALVDKVNEIKFFEISTILRRGAIEPPPGIKKRIDEELKPSIEKNKGKLKGPKRLKTVKISVVMNDKEAMVMFTKTGKDEPDMNEAFYGNNKEFHQWCLDYFRHCWENATVS